MTQEQARPTRSAARRASTPAAADPGGPGTAAPAGVAAPALVSLGLTGISADR